VADLDAPLPLTMAPPTDFQFYFSSSIGLNILIKKDATLFLRLI
jgi:hypothetical protein